MKPGCLSTNCKYSYVWLHACILFASAEITCTSATVVETPQSQNVSAGQEVEFTCVTSSSDSTIGWAFSTNFGSVTSIDSMLPGGGTHSTRRFTASVDHNQSTVTCIVISGGTTASYTGFLLVQGKCIFLQKSKRDVGMGG